MTYAQLEAAVGLYLAVHLDMEFWSALEQSRKQASVLMAFSDVMSRLPRRIRLEDIGDSSPVVKAVGEQAVFLARNYEATSEGRVVTSESVGELSQSFTLIGDQTISPRAAMFIEQAKKSSGFCRINRG